MDILHGAKILNESAGVAAVVILFKPDLIALKELLDSVKNQVGAIFVIDNTPTSLLPDYSGLFSPEMHYHSMGDNYGIATAQNEGIRQAMAAGCTHVLTLDQDSKLPEGMVANLLRTETRLKSQGRSVAVIGPSFVDMKTGERGAAIRSSSFKVTRVPVNEQCTGPVLSDYLISSGSLMSVEVLNDVGLMDEDLFIDWVDIEWGERAARKGYTSYIDPHVVMEHCIGDHFVNVFGRNINIHSDFRNYFIVRNAVFLSLRRRIQPALLILLVKSPLYIVGYSVFSKHKIKSLALLSIAAWHGLRGKMGKGYFE